MIGFEASFRGVKFHVEENSLSFGRRTASHEYPYRDDPWVDDLGRKQRRFTVRAFLLGRDIAAQREALIEAHENKGPGVLIHSKFGQLRVQPGECRWVAGKSTREDFDLEYLEPTAESQPQSTINTVSRVNDAVSNQLASTVESFTRGFDVAATIQFVRDDATAFVNRGLSSLRDINGAIQGAIAPVSDIAFAIDKIGSEITSLINTPAQLASSIVSVVAETFELFDDVDTAVASYRNIERIWGDVDDVPNASVNTSLPAATVNTPQRQQQVANRQAVAVLFRRAAVAAAVKSIVKQSAAINVTDVSQSPFNSYNQAITLRDTLLAAIDDEMLIADYESYTPLAELQSVLHEHIDAHGVQLPRIQQLSVNGGNVLALAYRLYGDANRAEDIIERNAIASPLFLPVGELEVASV